MAKYPAVYIITNKPLGVLYLGVSSDLPKRMYQHKNKLFDGFSQKYNLNRLVWFIMAETMYAAISEEKRIKRWNRTWKIELIEKVNPDWDDLSLNWFED